MSNHYIGAHILGNKTILDNIKKCVSFDGNAIQIFLKSLHSYLRTLKIGLIC